MSTNTDTPEETRSPKILPAAAVVALAFVCVCACVFWYRCSEPATPPPLPPQEREAAPAAMSKQEVAQLLNQLVWVTARVMQYNDIRALEEASHTLSQNCLDLSKMDNAMIAELSQDIRELVVASRINNGERRLMEKEIAARRAKILWRALSKAGNVSGDTLAINMGYAIVQGVGAYMDEKIDLPISADKKRMELNHRQLQTLAAFETKLSSKVATLEKMHGFPDEWRLSVSDAENLANQLKGKEDRDVMLYLQQAIVQERFRHLPEYWFHRGMRELKEAEHAPELLPKAKESLLRYQAMNCIYRRSREEATAAIGIITILGKELSTRAADHKEKESIEQDIRRQIERIEKYTNDADLAHTWQDWIAMHSAYKMVGDNAKAQRKLLDVLVQLKNESSTMVQQDLNRDTSPSQIASLAEPIALCSAILIQNVFAADAKSPENQETLRELEKILSSEYGALQTKAEYYGRISEKKQREIVRKSIKGTSCAIKDGEVEFTIPWRFFLLEDVKCRLWAHKDRTRKETIDFAEIKPKSPQIVWGEKEPSFVKIYFSDGKKAKAILERGGSIELDILHERMPVGLVFDKNSALPRAVRFGHKHTGTGAPERFMYWEKL